jgi:hypothetical protein
VKQQLSNEQRAEIRKWYQKPRSEWPRTIILALGRDPEELHLFIECSSLRLWTGVMPTNVDEVAEIRARAESGYGLPKDIRSAFPVCMWPDELQKEPRFSLACINEGI